ncbi:MAG: hypothetical protein LBQ47_04905 [Endomicrobium sp.]|jgi:hypothetical protein|nr:hypothetical protein [Endomicrobium sp.]
MYDINLVGKVVLTSERNLKAVRFLKLLSLFLTFALFGLAGLVFFTFVQINENSIRITQLKGQIDENRRIHKLKEVETEWTSNYYKIIAVKDLITKNTRSGLLLRDIGLYFPEGDKLCAFALTSDNKIKESVKIKDFSNSYDIPSYANILKEAYIRSSFIGEPITVEEEPQIITGMGPKNFEALNVTIPYVAEKK